MRKHITLLGALYIACTILNLVFGCVLLIFALLIARLLVPPESLHLLIPVAQIAGTFLLILVLPSLFTGIGLLKQRKWAFTLALILGCVNLISFPFGTILGGYTIWVMFNHEE